MKNIYIVILVLLGFNVNAQFQKAEIKIHGLTCSLCSRSVEMALKKVVFVEKIDTDLETTNTTVTFKKDAIVFPEELAKAVDRAGFSIGFIKMMYSFNDDFDKCYEDEDLAFTFLNHDGVFGAGLKEIIFIEQDMMNNKMFKEYKDNIPVQCTTTKRHYYVALADDLVIN